uniref:Uncharacterized protein n=1 Tax=Pyramimonas obovata TaxID=1411642 RepID=A0A7S0RQ74_9CHLO|mmetsp:Transcript_3965/g.8171  ORF Transcript_3965/g.8171 Transcript_3965/m.8171 type:complete len:243 (+) Transcript_3965:207-935(+)
MLKHLGLFSAIWLALIGGCLANESSLEQLELCDCHYAEDGLVSCPLDGFFVAGFRAAGYPLNRQSELLPLSPAICCRPCMPKEKSLGNDEAVAVVTRNCVPALGKNQETCDASSNTLFLQGYEQVQIVPSAHEYFPHGSPQCCQPALLLKSGLVKPLVRCNCEANARPSDHSISCNIQAGGTSQSTPADAEAGGHLIWGYKHAINVDKTFPVPSGPAQCCGVCVDPSLPSERPEECEAHALE